MKKIYTFLILAVLSVSTFATNEIVSGVISTNTTWSTDTVFVDGDINISGAATLTINEGTIILFNDFYKIRVDSGNVISIGTELEPIIFTAKGAIDYYDFSHTNWNGIEFYNENDSLTNLDSSKFVYTNFYYGHEQDEYYGGGAFLINNFSNLLINHCTFKYNHSNDCGGAIGIQNQSSPIITNSLFQYNIAEDGGGAIQIGCSNDDDTLKALIEDCVFEYNQSLYVDDPYYGGGAIKIGGYSTPIINRNYIAHNSSRSHGGGIVSSGISHPTVTNNVIVHNICDVNGGGIKVSYESNPFILNNTIAYNIAGNGGGMSIGGKTDSILVKNNIIYGNRAKKGNQFFVTLYNDAGTYYKWQIENNNIEGIRDSSISTVDTLSMYFNLKGDSVYTGTFINNIDVDPLFVDTISKFSLMSCSDCINAGDTVNTFVTTVDFAQNNRIFDKIVDLGAYEYQYLQVVTKNVDDAVCDGDSLFLEGQWQTLAGTYTDTLIGVLYCDSIVITDLTINTNPIVTITGADTILSNEFTTLDAGAGFESYTWNNSSSDQTLTVDGYVVGVGSHTYTVEVEGANGCTATDSIVVVVDLYNNINNIAETEVKIYPNPNNGEFTIEANNVKVNIVDSKGVVVYVNQFSNNSVENINLTNLSKGIYFVKIISSEFIKTKKILIY